MNKQKLNMFIKSVITKLISNHEFPEIKAKVFHQYNSYASHYATISNP